MRGELVQRAAAIKEEMAAGSANVPFKKVLECNIGNPQAPPRQQEMGESRRLDGRRPRPTQGSGHGKPPGLSVTCPCRVS